MAVLRANYFRQNLVSDIIAAEQYGKPSVTSRFVCMTSTCVTNGPKIRNPGKLLLRKDQNYLTKLGRLGSVGVIMERPGQGFQRLYTHSWGFVYSGNLYPTDKFTYHFKLRNLELHGRGASSIVSTANIGFDCRHPQTCRSH